MKIFYLILSLLLTVAFGAVAQDEIRLGYCGEMNAGYGEAGASVTPWITLTPEKAGPYAGCRITKIRVGLLSKVSNFYVYIRRDREDKENLISQKVGKLEAGWQTIELETPYEIKAGEAFAIGYKGSFSKAGGAAYTNGKVDDACHVFTNTTSTWSDVNGAFCIQAIVEGTAIPANEIGVISLSDGILPFGAEETVLTARLENLGTEPVSSFSYCLSTDGEEMLSRTVELSIGVNETTDVEILVPAAGIGRHTVEFTVTEVNSLPDTYTDNNTAVAIVTERDPSFMRRVVAEEATGTWCSWCPRGIVGLEMMAEKYPDQFIGIAVHSGDVMSVASYSPLLSTITSLPGCRVDRNLSGDPYEDIERMFNTEMNQECHIGYSLKTTLGGNTVLATATVKADRFTAASALSFAFTVVENNVGEEGNPLYSQKNSYSGSDIDMGGFQDLPSVIMDFKFQDVARGIFGSYEGEELLTDDIAENGEAEVVYQFELPDNILNVKNISIVGMVIDRSNGFILNAERTPLVSDPTGVYATEPDLSVISEEYYSADGIRVSTPAIHSGLIIKVSRMSDGSVKSEKLISIR